MTEDLASPTEPIWLLWAREIQALAQTGLAFTRDQYDRERYQQLHAVAAQIIAKHTGLDVRDIDMLFSQQAGYATSRSGDGRRASLVLAGWLGGRERESFRRRCSGST